MDYRGLAQQLRRGMLVALVAPLLLALAGCPSDNAGSSAAPGKAPLSATAPAVANETPEQKAAAEQAAEDAQDAQDEAAQQHTQKVQALIGRAENSYRSGVANYNANRLDAARMDFNFAVDTMLESGMDLKNDPQLSDEFEHLVDAINSLELVALKQGNGFSPKVEPAPLDEAINEVTFPPDPELEGRLNAELRTTQSDLPLVVNNYVAGFIHYFSDSPGGHAHLVASLERAGKYKSMIQRILKQYGVPQDLIYLAVAESGFQPQALNHRSGAGGMWQFMPFAGAYGLERNGYFDERFDPEKSTIAYAKYMKYLHSQFGDWYLAMAAYDWGPGYVQRAVARTGYADFWKLYQLNALPAETKNYVPGILAAVIMAKNPKQYGLADLVPDAPVVFDTVTTEYAISLPLTADLTNTSVEQIVALNPALLRMATPKDIPYDLRLPKGTKQNFLDRLKEIPEDDRDTWRFHVVKDGETLDTIATKYHVRASAIASFNDVNDTQPIEAGDELVIPVEARPTGRQRYKTRSGDTLVTVADRFGVSVEDLRKWNHLRSNRIGRDHTLYVSEPVRLAPSVRTRRERHSRSRHSSRSRTTHHSSTKTSSLHTRKPSSHKRATKTTHRPCSSKKGARCR